MNILKKEILPKDSPIILGFQHFILTAVLLGILTSMASVALMSTTLHLAYSDNTLLLVLMFSAVLAVATAMATYFLKKRILDSKRQGTVVLWGATFGLLTFILFGWIEIDTNGLESVDFITTVMIAVGSFVVYYGVSTTILNIKKITLTKVS